MLSIGFTCCDDDALTTSCVDCALQEAIQYYQKALTYNVQYPDAYYNLGVAYGEAGDFEKGTKAAALLP